MYEFQVREFIFHVDINLPQPHSTTMSDCTLTAGHNINIAAVEEKLLAAFPDFLRPYSSETDYPNPFSDVSPSSLLHDLGTTGPDVDNSLIPEMDCPIPLSDASPSILLRDLGTARPDVDNSPIPGRVSESLRLPSPISTFPNLTFPNIPLAHDLPAYYPGPVMFLPIFPPMYSAHSTPVFPSQVPSGYHDRAYALDPCVDLHRTTPYSRVDSHRTTPYSRVAPSHSGSNKCYKWGSRWKDWETEGFEVELGIIRFAALRGYIWSFCNFQTLHETSAQICLSKSIEDYRTNNPGKPVPGT